MNLRSGARDTQATQASASAEPHGQQAPTLTFLDEGDPRVRQLNGAPVRAGADYVLYWSQVYRRGVDNAALAYAIERADALALPVLFYEALRPDYPHASDRFHTFVLECARDTQAVLKRRGIAHAFFLPKTASEARGVVAKLAARAALVVSDDFPGFIVPAQNAAAAQRAPCAYRVVDDCAGLPLALFPKQESAARTLRPKLLKVRDAWLAKLHDPDPRIFVEGFDLPFEPLTFEGLDVEARVAECAIDHQVPRVEETVGGSGEAAQRLARFVKHRLSRYAEERNDVSHHGSTELSPYLHFGAISARAVALSVRAAMAEAAGSRGGHAVQQGGEAILEQLLVRRGLAYNLARTNPNHASYGIIPSWAQRTLAEHRADKRAATLTLAELDAARSPDELWNAAQLELRVRGVIQNYPRMLWGKLVITWMADPAKAHATLVHLNDRYALDGRDPDGWANIGWCFGLHDRPWPERAIFGTVRSMTSRSAVSKLDFDGYLASARGWRKALGS